MNKLESIIYWSLVPMGLIVLIPYAVNILIVNRRITNEKRKEE